MSADREDAWYLRTILPNRRMLDASSYLDWIKGLRSILRSVGKLDLVERRSKDMTSLDPTRCRSLMLSNMNGQIRDDLQFLDAYEMICAIRHRFRAETNAERQRITQLLISCKMNEKSSMNSHMRRIRGYLDTIAALGSPITPRVALNFILMSLPSSYDWFIRNHCSISPDIEISVTDMHRMLTDAERENLRRGDPEDRKRSKEEALRTEEVAERLYSEALEFTKQREERRKKLEAEATREAIRKAESKVKGVRPKTKDSSGARTKDKVLPKVRSKVEDKELPKTKRKIQTEDKELPEVGDKRKAEAEPERVVKFFRKFPWLDLYGYCIYRGRKTHVASRCLNCKAMIAKGFDLYFKKSIPKSSWIKI
jgi:hypothetical protein